MKIIGFNISKILIERKHPVQGELKIQNKLDISDIISEEVPISKNSALRFEFSFNIDYEPKVANIEIKGHVLTLDENEESKDILKEWKAKKTFNHESKIGLLNFIINKCNIKILPLEDELGLPLHIPFPQLTPQKQNPLSENRAKYTG